MVGAAGVPNMVTPEVISPGACVIGGGMTWHGRKALSDVDERCGEVAGWVTPRLGGVGVTTVAMLLRNTVTAAETSFKVGALALRLKTMARVSDLLMAGRTYSFEFFPPKNDDELTRLVQALRELSRCGRRSSRSPTGVGRPLAPARPTWSSGCCAGQP